MGIMFPKRVTVQAVINSETLSVSTEGWSEEFIVSMFAQGWKIRMDRCTADDKTGAEKQTSRQKKFDAFCKGDLGEVGSGGGPRLGIEEKAEIDWLNSKKIKGEKEVNGKSLQMSMMTECRVRLLKHKPDLANAGPGELNKAVQDAFPKWRENMRANDPVLKEMIRIEKESREVKSSGLSGQDFSGF
jgi:hypothetical protein